MEAAGMAGAAVLQPLSACAMPAFASGMERPRALTELQRSANAGARLAGAQDCAAAAGAVKGLAACRKRSAHDSLIVEQKNGVAERAMDVVYADQHVRAHAADAGSQRNEDAEEAPCYASDAESYSSFGSALNQKCQGDGGRFPPVDCASSSLNLKLDSRRPLKASRLISKPASRRSAGALASQSGWNKLKAFHRPKSKDDYSNPEACVHHKFGSLRRNWSFLQLAGAAQATSDDESPCDSTSESLAPFGSELRCEAFGDAARTEIGEKESMLLDGTPVPVSANAAAFDMRSLGCAEERENEVQGVDSHEERNLGASWRDSGPDAVFGEADRSRAVFSPVSMTSSLAELGGGLSDCAADAFRMDAHTD
eukprot:CAMPEP_0185830254 /NCGR_PEP_ID=MMETSP1353-20130828/718_1 /TAXON_ID=1077150 /ORGANISM="Erythrolobus australicus, Strain CCMP3124" /LENGTH=367 /DNA_ID=CAMNT_0028528129 /DNA_START=182 /DNA_END=1285 /DNA_ORIENTATION=+